MLTEINLMGLSSKSVTIISAMAGLAVFSQAPEFTQQYRQRIGGAVDELKTVVMDFDKDADGAQLSRNQALDKMARSTEQLTQDRGQSMTRTVGRFERLTEQQSWLENSHPLTKPLLVLKSLDGPLFENAWKTFEPAVPLTSSGFIYGGLGAFLAMILARLGIGGTRRLGQRRSDRRLAKATEHPQSSDSSGIDGAELGSRNNEKAESSKHDSDSEVEYDNSKLDSRMENIHTHSKGVPASMQVAPEGREKAPYLKNDPEDQAD
ncbi:MAG: DUF2937 family protein [Hyphomicrobiales bacterium]|nr:DUF2937 family protein [Hyphomicrobiales bacterium]